MPKGAAVGGRLWRFLRFPLIFQSFFLKFVMPEIHSPVSRIVTSPFVKAYARFTLSAVRRLISRAAARKPDYVPDSGSMLYVAASCLPYHVSGYTSRTREVLRELSEQGIRLHALTRPGYPWDRIDALNAPETQRDPRYQTELREASSDGVTAVTVIDGVPYDHIPHPVNNMPTAMYVKRAAVVLERYLREHRISCAQAASNHVNALPALIAAKRLGIPFHYEMRGLWELTRISRVPEYEKSPLFRLGLDLEALTALNADKVLVISLAMGDYIAKNWGVPQDKIFLLPNCADINRILPDATETSPSSESGPFVIGYAGSLVVYEGLETLIRAARMLRDRNLFFVIRIIGDGEYRQKLENLVQELELSECVEFLGRLPPDEARKRQGDFHVVCLPRDPYDVTRIVPPIKLAEAMAKEKAVIVPDLQVFREELSESGNPEDSGCLFFKSGDPEDLARVLERCILDPAMLEERGRRARAYVSSYRQWGSFIGNALPGNAVP